MSNCLIILSVGFFLLPVQGRSQIDSKGLPLSPNEKSEILLSAHSSNTDSNRSSTAVNFRTDSVPQKVFRLVNTVSINSLSSFKKQITDSLSPFKSIRSELEAAARNPLQLKSGQTDYAGVADSSYINNTSTKSRAGYLDNFTVNSNWSVAGIAATVNLQNQSWTEADNNREMVAIRFDKDNYLKQIKQKLAGKYDPSSLLKLPADAAQRMAEEAKRALHTELNNLNDKYKGLLTNELSAVAGITNLSSIDIKSLRSQFLNPDFIRQVKEKENVVATLQQKINLGENVNQEELTRLQTDVTKLKAVQELITRVESHQSKWESSGLLKKIQESALLQKSQLAQLINDPSTIRKMAKKYLSLKGVQRLFLNINRFDIGQNALSLSPVSFRSFLSNGVVTDFLNKGKSIVVMTGRQKDFNSVIDYAFSSNLMSNSGVAKAARMELSKSKSYSSHVALSSFNQTLLSTLAPFNAAEFKKVLVTTLSNELTLHQKGSLSIDISRSATQYQHSPGLSDSTIKNRSPLSGILSGDNLLDNTAIAIRYADELPASGLTYQLSFNKTANGYANPGNSFLSNGSTELGLNLRKTFLKNRIQVSVRANNRVYNFSEKENQKWKSSYLTMDARWKMKKGQYLAVRYQPVRMIRVEQSSKQALSTVDRFSLDGNFYKRFAKFTYRNLVTLSYLKSSYDFIQSPVKNSSLAINSFQNITIGKNLLYINTSYDKAANETGYIYLNSSFLTEAGFSYQVYKIVSMSSGITYNSVAGWYKQAGIRQTISGQLGTKFSINLYLDARKNIAVYQPLWNQPLRADIGLRYIFGNNE